MCQFYRIKSSEVSLQELNEINQEMICFFTMILINTVSDIFSNIICICSLLDEEEYHNILDEEQTQAWFK